jgi:putative NIF3 family GTP cyclohydrolase 1 type 2
MQHSSTKLRVNGYNRKTFLTQSLKITGGLSLLSVPGLAMANTLLPTQNEYTVQQVMDIILKEVPGAPFKDTVDTLKSGDGNNKVTGIITTMFATIALIKTAMQQKANFIIAHEPTFYNHADDKQMVKDNNIVQEKVDLLAKHNITIWRFHDYCHALVPDAISYGVAKKAGWLSYYKQGETILELPPVSFTTLVQHVKKSLQIAHLRVIGNPTQSCQRIALLPGAWGAKRQISTVLEKKPDVLIIGEAQEWETVEFIRDARLLGHHTALVVLGHSASEEPGMEWMADWLKPKLPGIKITHVASNDPFTWM